ncbi:MAG: hypothetical protein JXR23_05725 [Pontiellaceae bacterium]|nr:hypothetical protein [Pontiellaceae bacterium]
MQKQLCFIPCMFHDKATVSKEIVSDLQAEWYVSPYERLEGKGKIEASGSVAAGGFSAFLGAV